MKSRHARYGIVSFSVFLLVTLLHASVQPPTPALTPPAQVNVPETLKNEMIARTHVAEDVYDLRWNEFRALYFAFTLVPAFLTALAGLLPKLQPISADDPNEKQRKIRRENISLTIAMIAAFMLVVNSVAGFSKAASANRTARDAVRTLRKDIRENRVTGMSNLDTKLEEIEEQKSQDAS